MSKLLVLSGLFVFLAGPLSAQALTSDAAQNSPVPAVSADQQTWFAHAVDDMLTGPVTPETGRSTEQGPRSPTKN